MYRYDVQVLPPIRNSDHSAIQLTPTYLAKHKQSKTDKVTKQVIDEDCIDKCKYVFDTTDWSCLFNDNLDEAADNITSYINFTLASNSSCNEFYVNTNQRPWVTPEIRILFKEKHRAVKSKNDAKLNWSFKIS